MKPPDRSSKADDINSAPEVLPKLLKAASVYTNVFDPQPSGSTAAQFLSGSWGLRSEGLPKMLYSAKAQSIQKMMNELRVVKSTKEVEIMRKVGRASGRAMTEAMRESFVREKDLFAFLEYRFKAHECDRCAYVPVVAGGRVS